MSITLNSSDVKKNESNIEMEIHKDDSSIDTSSNQMVKSNLSSVIYSNSNDNNNNENQGKKYKLLYIPLVIFICFSGLFGTAYTGIIPGFSMSSVLNLYEKMDVNSNKVPPKANDELFTSIKISNQLPLPKPNVDVQKDVLVHFDTFDNNDNLNQLKTDLIDDAIGFVAEENDNLDNLIILENLEEQILLESKKEGLAKKEKNLNEINISEKDLIKSADKSRERKKKIESSTPSDRIFKNSIKINLK